MKRWKCGVVWRKYGVYMSNDENVILLASIYSLTKNERARVKTYKHLHQNGKTANLHNDMIETVSASKSINSGETLVVSVSQDE